MMLKGLAGGLGAGAGGDTAPVVQPPPVNKWAALSDGGLSAGDDKWAALYEGRPTPQPKVTADYEDPAATPPPEASGDMDIETNIDAQTNPESHTFSLDDLSDDDLADLYGRAQKAYLTPKRVNERQARNQIENPGAYAAGGVA